MVNRRVGGAEWWSIIGGNRGCIDARAYNFYASPFWNIIETRHAMAKETEGLLF